MILYIYIFYLQCCPFILYLDVILHCHLLLAQTLFLVFSVIVDMIEMNYLHFYLCMAVFVSPSCLKDSFNLLTDFFFPSSILNLSFLHLLTSSLLMRSQPLIMLLFRTMLFLWRPLQFSLPCSPHSSTAVLSTNVFCVS